MKKSLCATSVLGAVAIMSGVLASPAMADHEVQLTSTGGISYPGMCAIEVKDAGEKSLVRNYDNKLNQASLMLSQELAGAYPEIDSEILELNSITRKHTPGNSSYVGEWTKESREQFSELEAEVLEFLAPKGFKQSDLKYFLGINSSKFFEGMKSNFSFFVTRDGVWLFDGRSGSSSSTAQKYYSDVEGRKDRILPYLQAPLSYYVQNASDALKVHAEAAESGLFEELATSLNDALGYESQHAVAQKCLDHVKSIPDANDVPSVGAPGSSSLGSLGSL